MPEIGANPLGSSFSNNEDNSRFSRIEIARNDLLREFASISTENGYRNDVADVIKAIRPLVAITEFPEIGLQIGTRSVNPLDAAWETSDSFVDVFVQAAVESDANMEKSSEALIDAVESIIHDLSKVMATIYTKYIVSESARWNIAYKPYKIVPFFDFGKKSNKGIVILEFQIQLRSMGADFI